MPMRLPIDPKGEFKFNEPPPYVQNSQGDGMAVDKAGRFYVTSKLGVQIFDPTGRPCGVLPKVDDDQPLDDVRPRRPGSQRALHRARHDDLQPEADGPEGEIGGRANQLSAWAWPTPTGIARTEIGDARRSPRPLLPPPRTPPVQVGGPKWLAQSGVTHAGYTDMPLFIENYCAGTVGILHRPDEPRNSISSLGVPSLRSDVALAIRFAQPPVPVRS